MDYVEQRVAQEALKHEQSVPQATGFVTPLNIALLAIVLYTLYTLVLQSSGAASAGPAKEPPATVFRVFTPHTLLPFNGRDGAPVYMGVRGRVFDVSSGRNFYGPGGPYENFAGRDASRGLAMHSFDKEMLTEDLDGPLDPLSDLGREELEALAGWEERFESKYLVVGRLVAVDDYEKEKAKKG